MKYPALTLDEKKVVVNSEIKEKITSMKNSGLSTKQISKLLVIKFETVYNHYNINYREATKKRAREN